MNDLNFTNAFAVAIGATLGAWGRWALGVAFNSVWPNLPIGTLICNLSGGLIMGLAIGLFELYAAPSNALRLFVMTGFLGGLTTFSAFSGESMVLMLKEEYGWMAIHSLVHVLGALLMVIAGYMLVQQFRT